MGLQVDVHLFDEFQGAAPPRWLVDVASRAVAGAGRPAAAERLGVVVADDETVRDLNRAHRGIDETTDVLSFAFGGGGEYHGGAVDGPDADAGFVLPAGQATTLGEVVISYQQAVRQAEEAGVSVESELAHLLVHGVLHVLGYDHETPAEHASMKSLEEIILAEIPEMGDSAPHG